MYTLKPNYMRFYFDQETSQDYGFPYDNMPGGKPERRVIHSSALLRALGSKASQELRDNLEAQPRDVQADGAGFGWWRVADL